MPGERAHATLHAVLAVAFMVWAQRLRQRRTEGAGAAAGELEGERQEAFEALEADVDTLRRELLDAQERLDFAERLLAQGREGERVR